MWYFILLFLYILLYFVESFVAMQINPSTTGIDFFAVFSPLGIIQTAFYMVLFIIIDTSLMIGLLIYEVAEGTAYLIGRYGINKQSGKKFYEYARIIALLVYFIFVIYHTIVTPSVSGIDIITYLFISGIHKCVILSMFILAIRATVTFALGDFFAKK